MCGLFGYIGKQEENTLYAIRKLGIFNAVRGTDSTGMAIVSNNGLTINKKAIESGRFFKLDGTKKMLNINRGQPFLNVIGHTRAAVIGDVTDSNAQPFKLRELVFTHNGVINNYKKTKKRYNTKFEVDSWALGHEYINGCVNRIAENLKGWYTMAYLKMDSKNEQNFLVWRNILSFLKTKNGLYYASLPEHLKEIKKRFGIEGEISGTDDGMRYIAHYIPETETVKLAKLRFKEDEYDHKDSYFFGHDYDEYGRWRKKGKKGKKKKNKNLGKTIRLFGSYRDDADKEIDRLINKAKTEDEEMALENEKLELNEPRKWPERGWNDTAEHEAEKDYLEMADKIEEEDDYLAGEDDNDEANLKAFREVNAQKLKQIEREKIERTKREFAKLRKDIISRKEKKEKKNWWKPTRLYFKQRFPAICHKVDGILNHNRQRNLPAVIH